MEDTNDRVLCSWIESPFGKSLSETSLSAILSLKDPVLSPSSSSFSLDEMFQQRESLDINTDSIFSEFGFDGSFAMLRSVGDAFLDAYLPIVARRQGTPYGERERDFQLYRRGRYVEFNLVWDRGTHFGLQSGGRSESILLSMPPLVSWSYQRKNAKASPEARLYTHFLVRKDWV